MKTLTEEQKKLLYKGLYYVIGFVSRAPQIHPEIFSDSSEKYEFGEIASVGFRLLDLLTEENRADLKSVEEEVFSCKKKIKSRQWKSDPKLAPIYFIDKKLYLNKKDGQIYSGKELNVIFWDWLEKQKFDWDDLTILSEWNNFFDLRCHYEYPYWTFFEMAKIALKRKEFERIKSCMIHKIYNHICYNLNIRENDVNYFLANYMQYHYMVTKDYFLVHPDEVDCADI